MPRTHTSNRQTAVHISTVDDNHVDANRFHPFVAAIVEAAKYQPDRFVRDGSAYAGYDVNTNLRFNSTYMVDGRKSWRTRWFSKYTNTVRQSKNAANRYVTTLPMLSYTLNHDSIQLWLNDKEAEALCDVFHLPTQSAAGEQMKKETVDRIVATYTDATRRFREEQEDID